MKKNARCILTVWGQQDTQLNDYANRGWGGLTRSFYRERWKRFTDGVIAAVSEDKPFDEDKFHQDITQFEYNWTLQKDSFPIVSEEDPIQIADSLILKYDTYFNQSTIMKADIRQTGASKDTFFECSFSFFTEKKEIECLPLFYQLYKYIL